MFEIAKSFWLLILCIITWAWLHYFMYSYCEISSFINFSVHVGSGCDIMISESNAMKLMIHLLECCLQIKLKVFVEPCWLLICIYMKVDISFMKYFLFKICFNETSFASRLQPEVVCPVQWSLDRLEIALLSLYFVFQLELFIVDHDAIVWGCLYLMKSSHERTYFYYISCTFT